ncbi:uroporphyrinogen-III C-methyltransferase [Terrabacter tumescens]|uniref:uroporphyrinogen-III C-methyltransferase n=1 Tax=Terrabacter tumescens TaxID=60443 RepID=UPI000B2F8A5F|nr:uroporphyrinogen-III C-methyltransferase [Terrabacter tumescens]
MERELRREAAVLIETDLMGLPVLVVGPPGLTASTVRRYERAGAVVSVVTAPGGVTGEACARARLGVLVGPASTWATARAALAGRCPVVNEPVPDAPRGRVVLVGAGPGGLELMTLAGIRALADADVVLTDRLAEVGDVAALAPGAEVVDVGKRPGHHAVPQDEIERLMVERALAGSTVVRLKGGDPYVFGRGGEEVAAAVQAGLPVTVLPGVSSAVGVPGSAGIPVTHRGVSHTFTVVSGHVPLEPEQARALAGLGGTVVLLMGMHNLVPLTTALVRGGLAVDTPAAVVERGFSPDQRSIVGTLGTLPDLVSRARASSPSVIVVGEVVRQSAVWAARRVVAPPADKIVLDVVA